MEQVFTGWVFLNGLKAKPGATVTIKASSVAICGTPAATAASAEGRPFCSKAPEYNMQHEVVVGSNGVLANWAPRFSYHEVHFLVIEGLSEAPPPSADAPPSSAAAPPGSAVRRRAAPMRRRAAPPRC